jgi:hypothetical protein
MERNFNNEIEIAEGYYETERDLEHACFIARGVPEAVWQRHLERIIDRWDATDRLEYEIEWLEQEGINNPEDIMVDVIMAELPDFTLEQIQEHWNIGFNYTPIQQLQARG